MRRCMLLAVLAACGSGSKDLSPEHIVDSAHDGDAVTVEGTVFTLTFDDTLGADNNFTAGGDRWVLIRTTRPPGVTLDDLDSGNTIVAWGLGIHIPAGHLLDGPLPQIGDKLHVTGTFQHATWKDLQVPVIEDADIEIVETSTPALGMVGDSCAHDLDCHDQLICDRATTKCVAPPALVWEDDLRNVNGTCTTDADCPIDQTCDTRYVTQTTGEFAPFYDLARDGGKSLCAPADGATLADLCPRIITPADVSGGRYAPGKEVCVRATNWLSLHADDNDTHVQMALDEPLPYPRADTEYYIFGSTSENAPVYKDPTRPQGAVADPHAGDVTVAVGTIRYDPSHGWWEVHPIKAQFAESSGKGVRELQKRWKTHPGDLDIDELEKSWGTSEEDLVKPKPSSQPATPR